MGCCFFFFFCLFFLKSKVSVVMLAIKSECGVVDQNVPLLVSNRCNSQTCFLAKVILVILSAHFGVN